jgi:hypothetical protein
MTAEEYLTMSYEALDDIRRGLWNCAAIVVVMGLLNGILLICLIYMIEVHP